MEKQYLDRLYREREAEKQLHHGRPVAPVPPRSQQPIAPLVVEEKAAIDTVPPPSTRTRGRLFAAIGLTVILLVTLLGILFFKFRNTDALPHSLISSTHVTLYYPTQLPDGYKLDKATAKEVGGIVFFTFKDAAKQRQIVFSEQTAPSPPPDFDAIQKSSSTLKKTSAAGGQGIIGTSQGIPTAIILTNTTLVNISGSKNTPEVTVTNLLKNLQPLPD